MAAAAASSASARSSPSESSTAAANEIAITTLRGGGGGGSGGGADRHPLVLGLAEAAKSGLFADVKLVCGGIGASSSSSSSSSAADCKKRVFWSHRVLLASVSPFLKDVLLSADLVEESVLTLHLPNIQPCHLGLVMDYLYTGAMYLTPSNLTGVLRVIEVLRMKCGVSVSKMVHVSDVQQQTCPSEEDEWVEEAKFGGLDQFTFKQEMKDDYEEDEDYSYHSVSRKEEDNYLDSLKPIEVKPISEIDERRSEQRKSLDAMSIQVIDESSSEDDDDDDEIEEVKDEDCDADTSVEDATDSSAGVTHFKCTMCGKAFQHEDNLKVHIHGHLGVTAQLNSCIVCKRNFRSSIEHDLHASSHKYARFRNLRLHLANRESRRLQEGLRQKLLKRSIRTLVAKEVKHQAKMAPVASLPLPVAKPLNVQTSSSTTATTTTRKSSRPAKKSSKMLASPPKAAAAAAATASAVNPFRLTMKVKMPPPAASSAPTAAAKVPNQPRKRKPSKNLSPSSQSAAKKPKRTLEDDLTCPTCDKSFPSRSIFDRHVKTYKHGIYTVTGAASSPQSPLVLLQQHPLPHFNKVLQPTMELGGRLFNKYECHLCSKAFVRIKDLAKHREKACSAWYKAST